MNFFVCFREFCGPCLLFFLFFVPPVFAAPDALIQAANRAAADFREDIEHLASWAESGGLSDEARQTRAILLPDAPDRIFIPTFPLDVGTLDLPRGLPTTLPKEYAEPFLPKNRASDSEAVESDKSAPKGRRLSSREVWQIQFRTLRQQYAKRLAAMARGAVKKDRGTLAVQLAIAGLQADPDHTVFRNVFGFVKYKNQWRTPWEVDRLKKNHVDHETFGWMPQKAVLRYEKGERYCNGNWLSADDDDRFRRRSIEAGWKIESEHYELTTNHRLDEGVRLIRLLEDCYRAWKLQFFRYMATDAQLASLFDGKATPIPQKRHRVFIYRDKQYFTEVFQPDSKRKIDLLAGFYRSRGNEGACHFYGVDENAPKWEIQNVTATMYHEATHQLFAESRSRIAGYGKHYNYWLVEGVAMYMETLRKDGRGYYVLGGGGERAARRLKNQERILSFADLCRLTSKTFQDDLERGESRYAQSASAFQFLFDFEGGRWRDAMTVYLRMVYDGKDDLDTLCNLTGCSFTELDSEFERFLKRK